MKKKSIAIVLALAAIPALQAGVIKDVQECAGGRATFEVHWNDAQGNGHTDTVTLDCTPEKPALGETIEEHSGWNPGSSKCGRYIPPPHIPAQIFTGESFKCGQQDAELANNNE